ncbi:MAG TPA: amidohydrolase family protein, partial [Chthonomonadales bacterium]|nr:amidohydrolase family protein [Chthonomonadales bacterium]
MGNMWDASAFVGDWPFRRLPDSATGSLEARLRREGFRRAFVSPLAGLFHIDPQPANAEWGCRLKESAFFRFVPVINPTLPGWERSLDACRARCSAVAVRVFPNYHGYRPACDAVHALAQATVELSLPLFIQLRMQDMRSMHPRAVIPDVDWHEVLLLARACPHTTLVVAGANWSEASRIREEDLPNLHLVNSHMESLDGLRRFVDRFGVERLLLGTHAPLFTPTSARLKVEMASLTPQQRHAIVEGNARQLFRSADAAEERG